MTLPVLSLALFGAILDCFAARAGAKRKTLFFEERFGFLAEVTLFQITNRHRIGIRLVAIVEYEEFGILQIKTFPTNNDFRGLLACLDNEFNFAARHGQLSSSAIVFAGVYLTTWVFDKLHNRQGHTRECMQVLMTRRCILKDLHKFLSHALSGFHRRQVSSVPVRIRFLPMKTILGRKVQS